MKRMVTCQICGKQLSARGMVGHMRFAHGKDYKRPMLDVKRPSVREAYSKAKLWDKALAVGKLLAGRPHADDVKAAAVFSDRLHISKQEALGLLENAQIALAVQAYVEDEKRAKADEQKELQAIAKALRSAK